MVKTLDVVMDEDQCKMGEAVIGLGDHNSLSVVYKTLQGLEGLVNGYI